MVIPQTLRLSIGARVIKMEGHDVREVNQVTQNQQDSPVSKGSNVQKRSCLNMGAQVPGTKEAEPWCFSLFFPRCLSQESCAAWVPEYDACPIRHGCLSDRNSNYLSLQWHTQQVRRSSQQIGKSLRGCKSDPTRIQHTLSRLINHDLADERRVAGVMTDVPHSEWSARGPPYARYI